MLHLTSATRRANTLLDHAHVVGVKLPDSSLATDEQAFTFKFSDIIWQTPFDLVGLRLPSALF